MSDERLIRPEKVDELIHAIVSGAEEAGANMLELLQACNAVSASTKALIEQEGRRIIEEGSQEA